MKTNRVVPRARTPASALVAALATALALAIGSRAEGAEPIVGRFALDRYEPTPPGDRFFAVPSGGVDGDLAFRAGLSFDYAHDPLVLHDARGAVLGSTVSSQLVTHVGASLALWDQVLMSLDLPLALVNTGDDPADARVAATSPSGASAGDLRLGARVQLAGTRAASAELAIATDLWLPTGEPEQYSGDAGVRSLPHVAFDGTFRSWVYAAQAGVLVRETVEMLDTRVGTAAAYGLAAGYEVVPDRFVAGAEVFGSTLLASGGKPTHAELLASARLRLGDFTLGAAAGPGLGRAVGTPAVRVVAAFQYAPR